MNKKVFIGLTSVVFLAIVYVAFFYPWPSTEGLQGTFGGVKKYNAHQLSDKDVQVSAISDLDRTIITEYWNSAPDDQKKAFMNAYNNTAQVNATAPVNMSSQVNASAQLSQAADR